MKLSERLYNRSPFPVRRAMANLEGVRRIAYRKFGDYAALRDRLVAENPLVNGKPDEEALALLRQLQRRAAEGTVYYGREEYAVPLSELGDLARLPLLRRQDVVAYRQDFVASGATKRELYAGSTSGSTGTPVRYFTDRSSERMSKAFSELLEHMHGCRPGDRRVRCSGVKVVPFETPKPPYWIYIDLFRQLQCSALHISERTIAGYFGAFEKYAVTFGTGYALSWLFLAQAAEKRGLKPPALKVIITDSEGLAPSEQAYVERVFGCPVQQTYGLSETGVFSAMCPHGSYHVFPDKVMLEVVGEDGRPAAPGEAGSIAVTDLNSFGFPFLRYVTGDLGVMGQGACPCGWKSPYLAQLLGRDDDAVVLPDGRRVGRLCFLMRPAQNVLFSQLVQVDPEHLLIRVVPAAGFDPASMSAVLDNARTFLGDMDIRWEATDELEKSGSGKTKYVVRKF